MYSSTGQMLSGWGKLNSLGSNWIYTITAFLFPVKNNIALISWTECFSRCRTPTPESPGVLGKMQIPRAHRRQTYKLRLYGGRSHESVCSTSTPK